MIIRKSDYVCPKCLNVGTYFDGDDFVECTHWDEVEFFDDFTEPDLGEWINELEDDEEFGIEDSD
jgi:hypothetical protein